MPVISSINKQQKNLSLFNKCKYKLIQSQTFGTRLSNIQPHTKVPNQKYISKLNINSFIHHICIEYVLCSALSYVLGTKQWIKQISFWNLLSGVMNQHKKFVLNLLLFVYSIFYSLFTVFYSLFTDHNWKVSLPWEAI